MRPTLDEIQLCVLSYCCSEFVISSYYFLFCWYQCYLNVGPNYGSFKGLEANIYSGSSPLGDWFLQIYVLLCFPPLVCFYMCLPAADNVLSHPALQQRLYYAGVLPGLPYKSWLLCHTGRWNCLGGTVFIFNLGSL